MAAAAALCGLGGAGGSTSVHSAAAAAAAAGITGAAFAAGSAGASFSAPRRSGPASASTLQSEDWGVSGVAQYPGAKQVAGRARGSPRRTSVTGMRTAQQALSRVGGAPALPPDFPGGPYASLDMHMDRIKAWSKNPATGGGVFKIREKEVREAQKRVGATARLVCNREGVAKRGSLATAGSVGAADIPGGTACGGGAIRDRRRGSWRCSCKWAVSLEVVAGPDGAQQCAPRHFMPTNALPARPVPCYATGFPRHTTHSHAYQCSACTSHATPCRRHVTPRRRTPHATQQAYHATPHHATPRACHATPQACHATPRAPGVTADSVLTHAPHHIRSHFAFISQQLVRTRKMRKTRKIRESDDALAPEDEGAAARCGRKIDWGNGSGSVEFQGAASSSPSQHRRAVSVR